MRKALRDARGQLWLRRARARKRQAQALAIENKAIVASGEHLFVRRGLRTK